MSLAVTVRMALPLFAVLIDWQAALAQYSSPGPVPGGLPGAAPDPALRIPEAPTAAPTAPALPAPIAPQAPAAAAPDGCDCHAEVDVPVYDRGRIVGSRRERQVTGHSQQCCGR